MDYFFLFLTGPATMVERKKQNGGEKVRREVLPAAGIPLWVRPQGAQALQHAGQRPWSPLSGGPPPMRAGWRPGKLPTALAPGAWTLWPMAGRRRSRGHAAIYSAVELEQVLCPPLELRPAGLPAAPRSAIGWSWLVPAVFECCQQSQFKILLPLSAANV